jgi:hypothetical protein
MSGKLVSLFKHPEFVRRAQARATQKLEELVLGPRSASDEPPDFDTIEAFLDELFCEKK